MLHRWQSGWTKKVPTQSSLIAAVPTEALVKMPGSYVAFVTSFAKKGPIQLRKIGPGYFECMICWMLLLSRSSFIPKANQP